MPQSIPKGLTKEHVLGALADIDGGIDHPSGPPTGYELVHGGRRYAPKAVIGLACRSLIGRILLPEEFSGGEAPGQANFALRELGFLIEKKGSGATELDAEATRARSRAWSREEVDLIVADYFLMLGAELAGETYSKTEHNRDLRALLNNRSEGSVEFKHQNTSAVRMGMGLPCIDGYKPARNFQRAVLPKAIEEYLTRHSEFLEGLADSPLLNTVVGPSVTDQPVEDYFEERPNRIIIPPRDNKPWLSLRGKKIDFARREAMNRRLGQLGEKFAIELERRRLMSFGREDLAATMR